ncbi:Mucin-associated surface protein (MASP) [Trypanosoma cruzi]|uniref:Mucin-associated surface protein (MASP), putative n=2 Tax=Trypanosoma cruzi TaxID=5693 RepID=Q4E3X9_TRYCC|nr:mucin-associated surface protein (MASP), putative [Trypanosoma cruzi]EAN99465.1 mucin-associated surface protein (MASP), putative [Trypanosoma cruzi]PWV14407.1 Mucin-associated surface protein (MASP) [Trypanosoma cruzi]RNC40153.1 mucin-associated surface protein (MASP) [Trypanosoma cruzi]|eukprot:XP_821316.1 mucin-associated surface protein (MASP) [Trypanosoma cruzi strain CL Brener]
MAMMMAGRVLLVCALCVLWCGAGGVYARDTLNNSPGVCMVPGGFGKKTSYLASGCNKNSPTLSLRPALPIAVIQAEDTEEDAGSDITPGGGGGGSGLNSARQDGSGSSQTDSVPGAGLLPPAGVSGVGGNPSGSVTPGGDSSPDRSVGTGTSASLSSTLQGESGKKVLQRDEAKDQNHQLPNGKAPDTPVVETQSRGSDTTRGQDVGGASTLSGKEQRSSEEPEKKDGDSDIPQTVNTPEDQNKELQEKGKALLELSNGSLPEPKTDHPKTNPEKEKNGGQNTSASTDSPAKQEGNSEDPVSNSDTAESVSTGSQEQSATTSSNEGSSPIQKETSTEKNTVENSQPSDTAQTEKRQSVNKEKVGDSDSSTAVSHATSSLLLLLLVVACAAAAAVVAA